MEMACARCLRLWVPAASIATDVGKIAAAPMPAITWPVSRTPTPSDGVKKPIRPPTTIRRRADGQQPLAAEQVADHAEGELEQRDRHQEGVGDPGQLRRRRAQVLVDEAVDDGRDRQADLGDGDGARRGEQGAAAQLRADAVDTPVPAAVSLMVEKRTTKETGCTGFLSN